MEVYDNYLFPEFKLPQWFNPPNILKDTLAKAWNKKYSDLYDKDGKFEIYNSFKEILKVIGMPEDDATHKIYVYIGWSIASVAYFRLSALVPEDKRPVTTIKMVHQWLRKDLKLPFNLAETMFPDYKRGDLYRNDDAYEVIYEFAEILDKNKAYQSLLWLLNDTFWGEALTNQKDSWIRAYFNWLIIDVIPSAYCQKFPSGLLVTGSIFTLDQDSDDFPF